MPFRTRCVVLLVPGLVGLFFVGFGCTGNEAPNPLDASVRCDEYSDAGYRWCCGRPSEYPGFSCLDRSQDGGEFGVYGKCRVAGQDFDGKVAGAQCCEGTVRVGYLVPDPADPSGCRSTRPPSLILCMPCGDGICDDGENVCNCSEDCLPAP
jgi:hypothetical protein